nr:MAG TPA: hypothetical protein [Caudoviricetes sp.]
MRGLLIHSYPPLLIYCTILTKKSVLFVYFHLNFFLNNRYN